MKPAQANSYGKLAPLFCGRQSRAFERSVTPRDGGRACSQNGLCRPTSHLGDTTRSRLLLRNTRLDSVNEFRHRRTVRRFASQFFFAPIPLPIRLASSTATHYAHHANTRDAGFKTCKTQSPGVP